MTATFSKWELAARSALARRGVGYHQATPLIEDARLHYEYSDSHDSWQVLGPPEQFAADVAAAEPAVLGAVDVQGKTARDYLSDAAFGLAFLGIVMSVLGSWAAGGLTIPVTVAGLTGTALASGALLAAQTVGALRASGHPRLAPWGIAVSAVLVVAAALAFTELPRTRIGEVPSVGIFAASLFLCWLLTLPDRSARDSLSAHDPSDAEAWFSRLHAVLVGRFDVPEKRATALVDEARAHVAAAGSTPHEEFPSLALYAHDLAQGEPMRRAPWWRTTTGRSIVRVAVPVLLLPAVGQAVTHGPTWITIGGTVVLVWLTWELLRAVQAFLRRGSPDRRRSP